MTALKYDQGKPPLDLVPSEPIWAVAEILAFGAEKYSKHNWRRGMEWSRMFAATRRHMDQFWDGNDFDKETGLCHLAHAICDLMFLYWYWEKGVGTDDRYRPEENPHS